MFNKMNILFSPSYLEFDILLLILFIICCISIYTSISSTNRFESVESFESSCCMERFRVIKVMNTIVDQLENKVDDITQLQKQNIQPEAVKKKLQAKISIFNGIVQDTTSKMTAFRTRFYKYHEQAQKRAEAKKAQASSGKSLSDQRSSNKKKKEKAQEKENKGRNKAKKVTTMK